MFEPDKLKDFDAVFMNNCCGELFLPRNLAKLPEADQQAARRRDERLRKSLADFVRGGKGLVGIHAACACFYKWPEYGEMIGAYFSHHPWNEKVTIKVDDPHSPLTAMFDKGGFTLKEEIYSFGDKGTRKAYYFETQPFSRAKVHVLLSIDGSTMDAKKLDRGGRKDHDYALSWIKTHGKGRVFYCAFGHAKGIFTNPAILKHMLAGIQFALGDLPAETTPSAKTTGAAAPARQQ
jgi:type 1 glutamine amidotransferase